MVPFTSTTDAVGPGQPNRAVDVALVQDLIARAKAAAPPQKASSPPAAPAAPDTVDGNATEALFAGIADYQKNTMGTPRPDRIVSASGPTYKRPLAGAGAAYKGPAQFLQTPIGQWKSLDRTRFLALFATQFALPFDYNWVTPRTGGLLTYFA